MYDDYVELKPGGLERLGNLLETYFYEPFQNPTDNPTSLPATTTEGSSSGVNGWGAWDWVGTLRGRNKDSKLPQHNQPRIHSVLDGCPLGSRASPTSKHNYVLLCMPYKGVSRLSQPDVCQINTDQQFFGSLHDYYSKQRDSISRLWTFEFLRSVRQINFIQVSSPW